MRYYIIAGEASGDLHASNLVKELTLQNDQAVFRGWGGDKMQAAGVEIVQHYKEAAFMGFWEVLIHLKTILQNIKSCKQDILFFKPDAVILVDYPGFNLRIATFLKQQNIKTFYYISPQVWAWKSSRVQAIKRDIDHMLVILPFEQAFYKKYNYKVDYVGHPLLDAINKKVINKSSSKALSNKPIIALLPGSRAQEIIKKLPIMVALADKFQNYQFVIAGVSTINREIYKLYLKKNVSIIYEDTYSLLSQATAALVTSGTATLETALFNIPQVVCYKGSFLSYFIGKQVVKVKYISLVNLIMNKEVVPELIQADLTTQNLTVALKKILTGNHRETMLNEYVILKKQLGAGGASKKAAALINQYL